MWLTGNEIKKCINARTITIEPFNESQINPNSYNYLLNDTLLRLTDEVIDMHKPDSYELIKIPKEGHVLQPGECYLGATVETFGSNVYASLVTGRSSIGRKFVTNHVTAGLIDQGFFGSVTLEITCTRPTRVYANEKFGQIFWFVVKGDPLLYTGKYTHQSNVTRSRLHYNQEKRMPKCQD